MNSIRHDILEPALDGFKGSFTLARNLTHAVAVTVHDFVKQPSAAADRTSAVSALKRSPDEPKPRSKS